MKKEGLKFGIKFLVGAKFALVGGQYALVLAGISKLKIDALKEGAIVR